MNRARPVRNPGTAAWAAGRARELDQRAFELVTAARGGDWRARSRAEEAATRLRREAARFRGIAARHGGAVAG